jgi:hypothetical protein
VITGRQGLVKFIEGCKDGSGTPIELVHDMQPYERVRPAMRHTVRATELDWDACSVHA